MASVARGHCLPQTSRKEVNMTDLDRIMVNGRKPTIADLQQQITNLHLPALERMLGVDALVTIDPQFERAIIEVGKPTYIYLGNRCTIQKGQLKLEMQLRRLP